MENPIRIESVLIKESEITQPRDFSFDRVTSPNESLSRQITTLKNSIIKSSTQNNTISPIAINKFCPEIATLHNGVPQITSKQFGNFAKKPITPREITINKQAITSACKRLKWNRIESNFFKSSSSKINSFQLNPTQTNVLENNTSKVFFPTIIPIQKIFTSHTVIHNSNFHTLYQLNNSVNHTWSTLLPQTNIDISYEIKDLPTGQLAEATITGFDSQGKPNAGIVSIDHDANGVGWFIDSTPMESSEFAFSVTPDSEAYGKYNLLTTILHETAHLYGFMGGYSEFDKNVRYQNGRPTFIGDNFTAFLSNDGSRTAQAPKSNSGDASSHLDSIAHPLDLLNTHLAPGVRKLPSDINVLILNTIQNTPHVSP